MKASLLQDLAARLAVAGVARWSPSGAYGAGSLPAIFLGAVPASPDAAITLTAYPVEPGIGAEDTVTGVQVRTRTAGADPRTTWDLDDAIFSILHGLTNTTIAGRRVTQVRLRSGASLGQDDSKRWSWSSNYYLTHP